jgi:hypothetical protein
MTNDFQNMSPYGAWDFFVSGFYKYAAPTELKFCIRVQSVAKKSIAPSRPTRAAFAKAQTIFFEPPRHQGTKEETL